MSIDDRLTALWPKLLPLMLPYEGSASQLYVLDLPLNLLEKTIQIFCKHMDNAIVTTLNDYTYLLSEAPACDQNSIDKILKASEHSMHSIINGLLSKDRSLSVWIWPDSSQKTFDVELVFWADEFFPEGLSKKEHIASFDTLYKLANLFRQELPDCKCVLSSHETGDPRKELDEAWNVAW